MDWIFNVLPFLIFFFVVISVVRGVVKMARKMNETPPVTRSPATFDPGEAERTRRIQQEIRRKIAERRGQAAIEEPPRQFPTEEEQEQPPVQPERSPPEAPAGATMAAVMERQQQLADQMRELEAARGVQLRRAAAVASAKKVETDQATAIGVMRGALLEDLRDAPSARRAILLREILDRPVALRGAPAERRN